MCERHVDWAVKVKKITCLALLEASEALRTCSRYRRGNGRHLDGGMVGYCTSLVHLATKNQRYTEQVEILKT